MKNNYTIHVLHHTHWDREWYETFERLQLRLRNALRDVCDMLHNEKISSFYLDGQTCVLDDYKAIVSEEEFEILSELIRNGRIQVGPFYVLADEFLCPPEAFIKNIEIGRRMAKNLGSFCDIGYLPDTFGHISNMPQILTQFGIHHALLWRGSNPSQAEVNWIGADKSCVAAIVLPSRDGYYQTTIKQDNYEELMDAFVEFHKDKFKSGTMLFMDGADHTICNRDTMSRLNSYAQKRNLVIKETLMSDYLSEIKNYSIQESIEGELRDNSKIFVLSGTFSTRMYLKQLNQKCYFSLLHTMEFLNAFEQDSSNSTYFKEYVWKQYLKNQAHDSICGCSIDQVHEDMCIRYQNILNSIAQYKVSVLEALYPFEYKSKSVINEWLYVINNLPYSMERMVTAEILIQKDQDLGGISLSKNGVPISFVLLKREEREEFFHQTNKEPWYQDVISYNICFMLEFNGIESKAIHIMRESTPKEDKCSTLENNKSSSGDFIENDYYKISLKGENLQVFHKQTNKTYEHQHRIISSFDDGDTYNYSPPEQDCLFEATILSVQCTKNDLFQTMYVDYQMDLYYPDKSCKKVLINTTITLEKNQSLIDVKSKIINKATDHKLRIGFKILSCDFHKSDVTFDLVKRKTEHQLTYPTKFGEEIIVNQHPTNTMVVANDLLLVHEGMSEYEVSSFDGEDYCFLTALRCVSQLSKRDMRTRKGGAGPLFKAPMAQCQGTFEFHYGMVYGEDYHNMIHSLSLNTTPLVKQSYKKEGDLHKLTISDNLPYSSLQFEKGAYWLRLYNPLPESLEGEILCDNVQSIRGYNLGHELITQQPLSNNNQITILGKKIVTLYIEEK